MSDLTREALVAEAEKVNAGRTPGPWVLSTDWCDCGNGYGCSHGEFPFALTPHPRPEGWKPYESLIDSFDKATVADGEFMAFCGTHMTTLLSLLASEGEKVKRLEAKVLVLEEAATHVPPLKADRDRLAAEVEQVKHRYANLVEEAHDAEAAIERAEKAEAEVTRLTAQWSQLCEFVKRGDESNDLHGDDAYTLNNVLTKMAELEAQR